MGLAACEPEEKVADKDGYYDVSPGVAFDRLTGADIVGFRNARQCGMLIHFAIDPIPDRQITWTITSGDYRLGAFTVLFAARDKGTVISFAVPKGPNGGEIYDGKQTYNHGAVMQPLRPALRELVDSAIEGRAYDWHRIKGELSTVGDGVCSSERSNFQSSGTPYSIDDPPGMTHYQAEAIRGSGRRPQVDRDIIFGEQ